MIHWPKTIVRHKTHFNTNIHKLNLSVFRSSTFPMYTNRPEFSWYLLTNKTWWLKKTSHVMPFYTVQGGGNMKGDTGSWHQWGEIEERVAGGVMGAHCLSHRSSHSHSAQLPLTGTLCVACTQAIFCTSTHTHLYFKPVIHKMHNTLTLLHADVLRVMQLPRTTRNGTTLQVSHWALSHQLVWSLFYSTLALSSIPTAVLISFLRKPQARSLEIESAYWPRITKINQNNAKVKNCPDITIVNPFWSWAKSKAVWKNLKPLSVLKF